MKYHIFKDRATFRRKNEEVKQNHGGKESDHDNSKDGSQSFNKMHLKESKQYQESQDANHVSKEQEFHAMGLNPNVAIHVVRQSPAVRFSVDFQAEAIQTIHPNDEIEITTIYKDTVRSSPQFPPKVFMDSLAVENAYEGFRSTVTFSEDVSKTCSQRFLKTESDTITPPVSLLNCAPTSTEQEWKQKEMKCNADASFYGLEESESGLIEGNSPPPNGRDQNRVFFEFHLCKQTEREGHVERRDAVLTQKQPKTEGLTREIDERTPPLTSRKMASQKAEKKVNDASPGNIGRCQGNQDIFSKQSLQDDLVKRKVPPDEAMDEEADDLRRSSKLNNKKRKQKIVKERNVLHNTAVLTRDSNDSDSQVEQSHTDGTHHPVFKKNSLPTSPQRDGKRKKKKRRNWGLCDDFLAWEVETTEKRLTDVGYDLGGVTESENRKPVK